MKKFKQKKRPAKVKNANLAINYKIRSRLIYCAIFCAISAVCLFFSSMILFRAKYIDVNTNNIDAAARDAVYENLGINRGDNLLLIDENAVSKRLEDAIVDVDCVEIEKKFPDAIFINVKKANKAFDIEAAAGEYIAVSGKGKVLAVSDAHEEGLILLKGTEPESFEIGRKVTYKDKSVEKKISEFIEMMNANNLEKTTEIDFNNGHLFFATYDGRVRINFGFYENMDYKIKTAAEIINTKLGAAESGTLDLAEVFEENRSYFTPNY